MTAHSPSPSPTAESDLAFLRAIVQGGARPRPSVGTAYMWSGLLYGAQCLFHLGQIFGLVDVPGPVSLAFVVFITVAVLGVLVWASLEDKKAGAPGPLAARAINAAFSGVGMANLAMLVIFGVNAARSDDFSIWLYYPAVVFAFQGAVWFMIWQLKRKAWMGFTALGGWLTAVSLGLLVHDTTAYLGVCTAALFLLFALPGWIMLRDARAAAKAA